MLLATAEIHEQNRRSHVPDPHVAKAATCTLLPLRMPLALLVTTANEQDRAQVGALAQAVQDITGSAVRLQGQGSTGDAPAEAARAHSIPTGSRQTARSEARLRLIAQALGGGALLRLDRSNPSAGAR